MMNHSKHEEMVPALGIEDAVREFPEVGPSNHAVDLRETGWIAPYLLKSPVEIVSEGEIQADSFPGVPCLRVQDISVRR